MCAQPEKRTLLVDLQGTARDRFAILRLKFRRGRIVLTTVLPYAILLLPDQEEIEGKEAIPPCGRESPNVVPSFCHFNGKWLTEE